MAEIAKYIRIFNAAPTDDFVSKRITAVNAIENAIKKKVTTKDVLDFANGLLMALENSGNSNDVVNSVSIVALKKSSTAFVAEDESLQLITCTMLATLQILEKARAYDQKPSPEYILAAALWNGLSFQKPIADKERLEALRIELLQKATKIATDISETARSRKETKPRNIISVPSDNTFATHLTNVEASYGKLIDAMRINSILDREELDILWWTIGGWSSICSKQISALNPIQTCMVSSVEVGLLLRRFPSKAHTFLACKGADQNREFTDAEIIEHMGEELPKINVIINTNETLAYKKVFPVSSLLINPNDIEANNIKRPLHEWSARLLIEFSLNNISKFAE